VHPSTLGGVGNHFNLGAVPVWPRPAEASVNGRAPQPEGFL
jgi:hypothetical protein